MNEIEFNEDFLKEMISGSSQYILSKLKGQLERAKKNLEALKSSENKNKDKLIEKYLELNKTISSLIKNTGEQSRLQKESIELQEKAENLDSEIDSLLI